MSYVIAMSFISWIIAIWMLFGYLFIKDCEKEIDNEELSDLARENINAWLEEYNNSNFSGRVIFILSMGARIMSLMFKGKDE